MWNKTCFFIFLSLITSYLFSQKIYRCASQIRLEEAMKLDSTLSEKIYLSKQNTNEISNHKIASSYTKVVIPVVVHVLYNSSDPSQNISDAQIRSQIDVLNRDFNAQNADSLPTNHPFYNLRGNANIEFCLANKRPDSVATTGIQRKAITQTGFSSSITDENIIKSTFNGGLSAWNTKKYLNIWVVNFAGGTIGYSSFPDENAGNKDGVVVHYEHFGTVGTLGAPYDKGRTLTHEVGHWLGLFHIWGNDVEPEYDCATDDGIADTPPQYEPNFDCHCTEIFDICSNSIMYQNYMDYTKDACMSLFTKGQVQKMRDVLSTNNNRNTFLNNSVGCNTHTPSIDLGENCSIVSTKETILGNEIDIFPNPVQYILHIEKLPNSNTPYEIKIINNIGAVLVSKQVNANQTSIDMSVLSAGIYYVHITNSKLKAVRKIQVIK